MGGISRRCSFNVDHSAMTQDQKNLLVFVFGLVLAAVFLLPSSAHAYTIWKKTGFYELKRTAWGETGEDVAVAACLIFNDIDPNKWRETSFLSLGTVSSTTVTGKCQGEKWDPFTSTWKYSTFGNTNLGDIVNVATCPEGFEGNTTTNKCKKISVCAAGAGAVVSSGMYDLGTDENALPPTSTCNGQCVLSYTGSGVVARQVVNGAYHYFSQGSYTQVNQECSTSDALAGSSTLPPASCDSQTQDQGTVNGKFVCLDRATTTTTTTAPPVTNPDGSVTETTTSSDSKTGTDTVTTKTTAPDGTVTTSTTTQPTPGTSTEFCKANPSDPTCRKDDIPWGDIPEAGIIPTHDVPVSTTYTVIGGEGFCPADTSISFLGQSLTWSYGPICTFAEMIRPLVIGLAWLSFGFIIVGGLGRAR